MEKALFLFTTDALPYALHNINILSFPQGLSYRFRYKKNYVSKSVLESRLEIKTDQAKLPGYVIFQFKDGTYFPFRKIELIRAYDYGNLFFFYAVLKGIINIDWDSLPAITEQIKKIIGDEEAPPKKLVFLADEHKALFNITEERKEETNRVWSNSVDILSKSENLKNLSFLKFEILKGIKEREKTFPSTLTGDLSGYKFSPGRDYIIEFFEYASTQPTEKDESTKMFKVSIKSDPNRIEIIKPEEIVDGKYDRFDLMFSTLQEASEDTSFLRIENTQSKDDKRIPDIYIPFCVSLKPIWKVLRPILLLLSIFAFIDPKLIIWIANGFLGLIPSFRDYIHKILIHFDKAKWIQVLAALLFTFSFWNFNFRSMLKNIKDIFK